MKRHVGFTLIELLLAIGIIATLAAIVIIAVNPTDQLVSSQDAKRNTTIRELQNAIFQYIVDNSNEPGDKAFPTTLGSALPICRQHITGPDCINFDELVGDYVAELDEDPAATDANFTGYSVYLDQSFPRVISNHLGSGSTTITESGAFVGGTGSVANPYQIENCTQLQNIANDLTANYQLNRSINCDVAPFNTGLGFAPIGPNATPFSGIFDGQGFRIVNLYINRPTENDVALFGNVSDNSMFSVGLVNADITGNTTVGAFIGDQLSSLGSPTVTNVYATGEITGAAEVGGLIGEAQGNIINSYAFTTIRASGGSVGGLVGVNSNAPTASYYDATNLDCTLCLNTAGTQTFANLSSQSFLEGQGWDFSIAWQGNTGTYPTLRY